MSEQKDNFTPIRNTKGQPNAAQDSYVREYENLSLKTKKISTAIHMVTELVADKEPIKRALRSSSVDTLSGVTKCMHASKIEVTEALPGALKEIVYTQSLLDIAKTSGLVSAMNAKILVEELVILQKLLEERFRGMVSIESFSDHSPLVQSFTFPSGTFEDPIDESFYNRHKGQVVKDSSKGHDSVLYKPENKRTSSSTRKNDRRENILRIFNVKPEMTVKDLARYIKNCSEKTIQRELLKLVDEGVLDKVGDRRWSKYVLKKVK